MTRWWLLFIFLCCLLTLLSVLQLGINAGALAERKVWEAKPKEYIIMLRECWQGYCGPRYIEVKDRVPAFVPARRLELEQ